MKSLGLIQKMITMMAGLLIYLNYYKYSLKNKTDCHYFISISQLNIAYAFCNIHSGKNLIITKKQLRVSTNIFMNDKSIKFLKVYSIFGNSKYFSKLIVLF